MEPVIPLQILLRKPWRTKEGVATAREVCTRLGIEPTASGAATVSGRITPAVFETLFSISAENAAAPTTATRALPIPPELQEFVESITIAPPHIYMGS
jgi:hypothetical protein